MRPVPWIAIWLNNLSACLTGELSTKGNRAQPIHQIKNDVDEEEQWHHQHRPVVGAESVGIEAVVDVRVPVLSDDQIAVEDTTEVIGEIRESDFSKGLYRTEIRNHPFGTGR